MSDIWPDQEFARTTDAELRRIGEEVAAGREAKTNIEMYAFWSLRRKERHQRFDDMERWHRELREAFRLVREMEKEEK